METTCATAAWVRQKLESRSRRTRPGSSEQDERGALVEPRRGRGRRRRHLQVRQKASQGSVRAPRLHGRCGCETQEELLRVPSVRPQHFVHCFHKARFCCGRAKICRHLNSKQENFQFQLQDSVNGSEQAEYTELSLKIDIPVQTPTSSEKSRVPRFNFNLCILAQRLFVVRF